jgi:hypothetical protein
MMRAYLEINPRYQPVLEQQGLASAPQLLELPAVIVSGHPNRNVSRITVGTSSSALSAFLKLEHRVPWRDRLANAWAGFGLVSRSHREFRLLRSLQGAGVGCPDPIAVGQDGRGRAFLIVREVAGALDLRMFLHGRKATSPYHRLRFARRLGEALARLHDAGFDHPDLYAKHVLVDPVSESIRFLDWQRARKNGQLAWPQCWRGLASLHATLSDDLASARERLLCLRAYLRATVQIFVPRAFRAYAAHQIECRAHKLQRRRRIREQRRLPLETGAQSLIWLDGESLVVTRAFQEECQGLMPSWLTEASSRPGQGWNPCATVMHLPGNRRGVLVRRRTSRPLRWLWNRLRGHRLESPELMQVAVLFRLQRFGVRTPRLLAFGERFARPWQIESFLLIEQPTDAVPLTRWLHRQSQWPLWTAECKQRRSLIRQAGDYLRGIHDAGYRGHGVTERLFLVQASSPSLRTPALVLGALDEIDYRRSASTGRALRDLTDLHRLFGQALASRPDRLRFLLAYLGLWRLNDSAKRVARSVARNDQARADARPVAPRVHSNALSYSERAAS